MQKQASRIVFEAAQMPLSFLGIRSSASEVLDPQSFVFGPTSLELCCPARRKFIELDRCLDEKGCRDFTAHASLLPVLLVSVSKVPELPPVVYVSVIPARP